jgi:lipid-A-disaccharide synthase
MDEEVVTELIQEKFNTDNLKKELEKLLDESHRKSLLEKYHLLENKLGGIGASSKTAKFIINDLK